jgi:hypothetical protein
MPPETQLSAESSFDNFICLDAPTTDNDIAAGPNPLSQPARIESKLEGIESDVPELLSVSESESDGEESDRDDDDLPALQSPSCSEESDSDGSDAVSTHSAHSRPSSNAAGRSRKSPPAPPAGAKPKITAYWKVEAAEEKAVRQEREARAFAETREKKLMEEVEARR